MEKINILSLFDGISCGHIALDKAEIPINKYYASEIDKYAIKVTNKNYPETINLGDVTTVNGELFTEKIDLLIGVSPCPGLPQAGKMKNFDDPRSKLFWEYVRILQEVKPKYFLLENVVMKQEWQDIISEALGVKPIMIDSSLTSAATRKRLYWTNIPGVGQPEDLGITFGDIRERDVQEGSIYYTDKGLDWIRRHEKRTGKTLRIIGDSDKMQMLEASMYKKYSSQRFFGIEDTHGLRYITVTECERCMNVPDGYTDCCSNTQRYKQLGNGWEVNTITHIFRILKNVLEKCTDKVFHSENWR